MKTSIWSNYYLITGLLLSDRNPLKEDELLSLLLSRQKAEVHIKATSASSAGQRSGSEESQNKRKQQHKGREEEHTGGGLIIDCNTEEEQWYLKLAPVTEQKQDLQVPLVHTTPLTSISRTGPKGRGWVFI